MTLHFTHHAVERYRQFHMLERPGATDDEAREILERAADSAVRSGTTRRGDKTWMLQAIGVEVVTRHDDGTDVVVTVLPPAGFRAQPGQPGLTPMQVEALWISSQAAAERVKETKDELAAHPDPAKTPAVSKEARQRESAAALARGEAKRRHQIALIEQELFREAFKTARQVLHEEKAAGIRALSIAIEYLEAIAATDPQAAMVLRTVLAVKRGKVP